MLKSKLNSSVSVATGIYGQETVLAEATEKWIQVRHDTGSTGSSFKLLPEQARQLAYSFLLAADATERAQRDREDRKAELEKIVVARGDIYTVEMAEQFVNRQREHVEIPVLSEGGVPQIVSDLAELTSRYGAPLGDLNATLADYGIKFTRDNFGRLKVTKP